MTAKLRMLKLPFPQIHRINPARAVERILSVLLWVLVVAFFFINSGVRLREALYRLPAIADVLKLPFGKETHLSLARQLWEKRHLASARRELLLALELPIRTLPAASVLGATAEPEILLKDWESERSRLEETYQYWQRVVQMYPDYRDAYLMLASVSLRLRKPDESKTFLKMGKALDPNFRGFEELNQALNRYDQEE